MTPVRVKGKHSPARNRLASGAFTDAEQDRQIERLLEQLRKQGRHPRDNGVTVRRVDPVSLRGRGGR